MAINSPVLDMVAKIAEKLPQGARRMLCLGYPDMLVTEAQVDALLGAGASSRVDYRDDSESILRWHNLQSQAKRVPETRSLFAQLGLQCDFVDITASRGFEIVVDLNQPAPDALAGQYDIVYDGGTMEHCFNVGQVMRNICGFARVGGFIVHVNPINYYNHGFFNFNPTFYHDWYTQAGNAIVSPFYAMHGPVLASRLAVIDATGRYDPPARSVLVVAAMRMKEEVPSAWPMQTKYLNNSELKG